MSFWCSGLEPWVRKPIRRLINNPVHHGDRVWPPGFRPVQVLKPPTLILKKDDRNPDRYNRNPNPAPGTAI